MESFKLEIFKKENSKGRIDFSTLNTQDSIWVLSLIKDMFYGRIDVSTTQKFYQDLEDNIDVEHVGFDEIDNCILRDILTEYEINESSLCFVIWEIESSVDLIGFGELIDKWEYIWYDSSDEAMVIFIPGINRLLLVTDHGYIKIGGAEKASVVTAI